MNSNFLSFAVESAVKHSRNPAAGRPVDLDRESRTGMHTVFLDTPYNSETRPSRSPPPPPPTHPMSSIYVRHLRTPPPVPGTRSCEVPLENEPVPARLRWVPPAAERHAPLDCRSPTLSPPTPLPQQRVLRSQLPPPVAPPVSSSAVLLSPARVLSVSTPRTGRNCRASRQHRIGSHGSRGPSASRRTRKENHSTPKQLRETARKSSR